MFKKSTEYKMCTACVMDTSDEMIEFDSDGVCNHCLKFENLSKTSWFPGEDGKVKWREIVERIKSSGEGKDYDCILGLSGGVDSSYLAIKLRDWGLRPLVVHIDAGWNSELAVANIEAIVKHCGYDLHTHVVDWEEMRDLHLSYLRAGVSNQDVPQDHIFFSSLYHFAIKNGIKYILSGGNLATEGVAPDSWHGTAMDAINLKAIHKKYGTGKIKNYKTISFFQYYIWYPLFRKMRTFRPLNFMPYDKELALAELKRTVGYKPYARKHGESQFTKLFQNYYLPVKFGYDKRRPHFSSLIVSGQMTREVAIENLNEPLYDLEQIEIDISYFCKKLRISRAEFEGFMSAPIHHYTDFPNWDRRYRVVKWLQKFVALVTGKRWNVYS